MRKVVIVALLVLVATGVAACGGGRGSSTVTGEQHAPKAAEQGFLQAMVPHHESAVEMARVAQTEAQTAFVKKLAADIIRSQTAEIAQMRRIHQRLFDAPLTANPDGHEALGLSAEEAGMHHMDAAEKLRGKRPFDRAFVDEMIPHHQGAIRMAQALLIKTRDRELRTLAEEIISAQRREIEQMSAFRQREHGAGAAEPEPEPDHSGSGGH